MSEVKLFRQPGSIIAINGDIITRLIADNFDHRNELTEQLKDGKEIAPGREGEFQFSIDEIHHFEALSDNNYESCLVHFDDEKNIELKFKDEAQQRAFIEDMLERRKWLKSSERRDYNKTHERGKFDILENCKWAIFYTVLFAGASFFISFGDWDNFDSDRVTRSSKRAMAESFKSIENALGENAFVYIGIGFLCLGAVLCFFSLLPKKVSIYTLSKDRTEVAD